MSDLRSNVITDDDKVSKEKLTTLSTGSYGYGGKFGVEKDRMDKVTKLGSRNCCLFVILSAKRQAP